jgi:hypothetical protein
MGQSLAIWKWRAGWPFRSNQRVRRLIAEDRVPFALTRFDAKAFADEIRARFGDGEEPTFIIDVGDFKGHRANWIILSAGWGTPEQTLVELVRMCANRGLHIYAT